MISRTSIRDLRPLPRLRCSRETVLSQPVVIKSTGLAHSCRRQTLVTCCTCAAFFVLRIPSTGPPAQQGQALGTSHRLQSTPSFLGDIRRSNFADFEHVPISGRAPALTQAPASNRDDHQVVKQTVEYTRRIWKGSLRLNEYCTTSAQKVLAFLLAVGTFESAARPPSLTYKLELLGIYPSTVVDVAGQPTHQQLIPITSSYRRKPKPRNPDPLGLRNFLLESTRVLSGKKKAIGRQPGDPITAFSVTATGPPPGLSHLPICIQPRVCWPMASGEDHLSQRHRSEWRCIIDCFLSRYGSPYRHQSPIIGFGHGRG